MKKLLLFLLAAFAFSFVIAQERIPITNNSERKLVKQEYTRPVKGIYAAEKEHNPVVHYRYNIDDAYIGKTVYDMQTNGSVENRIYQFDDGVIGATWNMGLDQQTFNQERGTGVNYFDGTSWGPIPTERIEPQWAGWPSYYRWGPTGEIVVNHTWVDGLGVLTRPVKGEGIWTEVVLAGPVNHKDISWPRMVTSGPDHSTIHTISCTYSPYEDLDLALLYSRSDDGGISWDPDTLIMDQMTSDDYVGFSGDDYAMANSVGETVAFVVGSPWLNMFLMKSEDNGDSWDQTIIWEHPYEMFNFDITTDPFYCMDGSASVALDSDGMAHVVFGISWVWFEEAGTTFQHDVLVDGIGYWNETMDPFYGEDALDPEILYEDGQLIGWTQDVNGDGEVNFEEPIFVYRELGLSTMPYIVIDEFNRIFVSWSSTTETYILNDKNLKHVWMRSSPDGGETWGGFIHINKHGDPLHEYEESIYASLSPTSGDYVPLIYQADFIQGIATDGDHGYDTNRMIYFSVSKDSLITGYTHNTSAVNDLIVTQNFPNPCTETTTIQTIMGKPAVTCVEVFNIAGETVLQTKPQGLGRGVQYFTLDVSGLYPGVYFYRVTADDQFVVKKMIVR